MIIFQTDRALTREQEEIFRARFEAARDGGYPFVIPPGWTYKEIGVPAASSPLVVYQEQLGDA
jgi:hypothetical protein